MINMIISYSLIPNIKQISNNNGYDKCDKYGKCDNYDKYDKYDKI